MRVTGVFKPGDYPGNPDADTRADVAALFAQIFPGVADPGFDADHAGMAVTALSPKLALGLAGISRLIALDLPWCARADLRELAIQAVNLHLGAAYSFRARTVGAKSAGLSDAQLDALPDWQTSDLFDDEQRLVIDYALATVSGRVPTPLFARVKARFGERGTVELTAVAAFFASWAMLLNATAPDL
jgi:alkylhydroperoxidase family enzyme